MATFDGKSEKFELFENILQTSLKIHNQMTEEDRMNYFHSLMRGDALQTFKKNQWPNPSESGRNLGSFSKERRETPIDDDSGTQIPGTCPQPSKSNLVEFRDELQKLAKDAFRIAAHAIIKHIIYSKMPPHLKKTINHADLENGTNEQIVPHLERELELNGL